MFVLSDSVVSSLCFYLYCALLIRITGDDQGVQDPRLAVSTGRSATHKRPILTCNLTGEYQPKGPVFRVYSKVYE